MKIGTKLISINDIFINGERNITTGKEYDVVSGGHVFTIINDLGEPHSFDDRSDSGDCYKFWFKIKD